MVIKIATIINLAQGKATILKEKKIVYVSLFSILQLLLELYTDGPLFFGQEARKRITCDLL